MTKEALTLALEALEYPLNISHEGFNVDMAELLAHRAITSIKEALAQPEQEPVADMPSNTRYTVEVEGRGRTYWDNIHDAITNAQRAVYSGPDNTIHALDDLKAGRIAEWSYGFSAVRIYPPQNSAPPQRKPLMDEMVYAAARAMSEDHADACNIDRDDHWKLYGDIYSDDARLMLKAAYDIKDAAC